MELCNVVGIDTPLGFRSFELYEGDLTDPAAAADVLVVSAFANSYHPTPGTLIHALETRMGIVVASLLRNCLYDFRRELGLWLSQELATGHFRHILAMELRGGYQPLEEVLENIFVGLAILEAKHVEIQTLALPLVGSGLQGF